MDKIPLSKFLITDPDDDEEVLLNKATVFLYRVYDILSLLRQWKLSSGEQRTALAAKFQEPMDPTGEWFPGTIYEAMESPLDKGMAQVKEVKITLVDESDGLETLFLLSKTVEEQSITNWGHLVREMSSLLGKKVILDDLIDVVSDDRVMSFDYKKKDIDAVATYDALLHLYATPPYNEYFTEGIPSAIESGIWDIWYRANVRDIYR